MTPSPLSEQALGALEAQVQHAIATGDQSALHLIGWGEVTVALRLDTEQGSYACKRLPAFPDRAAAERCARAIENYVAALTAKGLTVVPTTAHILESSRELRLYLVQPALPREQLGPNHFRNLPLAQVLRDFDRVADCIERTLDPTLAPDGQLANWAFDGERILYLDVSTPFHKHADGTPTLEWKYFLGHLPAPLRSLAERKVLPALLDKYHELRPQMTDFAANLQKEKLEHLKAPIIARANERFGFDPPITEKEVRDYYRSDARTYAGIESVRRFTQWTRVTLLRKPPAELLPPRVDRNL